MNSNSLPINKNATAAFGTNPIPIPLSHSSQTAAAGGIHFSGHFQLSGGPHRHHPQAQIQNSPAGTTVMSSGIKRTQSQKPPPSSSRPSGSFSSGGQGGPTASPLKTMELTPASVKRRKKLSSENENEIPHKVAASFPESTFYTQMQELESRINAALTRKKTDMVESIPLHLQKLLRIYLFNTYSNNSWSLKITGRILEGGIDPAAAAVVGSQQHITSSSYPKFSSFFKKITVYLDQNLYPDNHVVLWESSRSPAAHEGFEVKRIGDKEFTAIVRLEMNFVPEKFKLTPALQQVLGVEVETRPRIIAALWHYIKTRKLQIPGDASSFMCDPPLRKVFGEEKLKFAAVIQKITEHLTSLKPIHLEHTIKLSGNSPVGNTCYDVLVDVPFVLEEEMTRFLATLETNTEIDDFDGVISDAIHNLREHCQRRDFFLAFSQSPAEFINALLASQARDLKLLSADTSRDKEREHQYQFYDQPWIEDAVTRYLNRKLTSIDPSGSK